VRLLFTIPHFYHSHAGGEADAAGKYGAYAADAEPRIEAMTACLTALHQLYQRAPCFIDHAHGTAHSVETLPPWTLDVVICTTEGRHLLDRLPIEPRYYTHRATQAEPLLLGFECHTVLHERLGGYDYYCYLEDDLILHDPWLFFKLAWFNRYAGDDKLLQPNRYEAALNYLLPKVYVDGYLETHCTAAYQNIQDSGSFAAEVLGVPVEFIRTLNPHSGCFFLSARQMEMWASQPYFFDRTSRFIGPLETSATLGILRTFQIYRPAPRNADFLEIQHFGDGYLKRLHRQTGKNQYEPKA
jgi:hypothetical protein